MDEKKPDAPRTTSLFVTNPDILIEEDPNITPVRVDCQSYVREKLEANYTYFMHPFFGNPTQETWPSKTDKDCLHCCHGFETYPIPIPRRYDDRREKYYTFGIFCSANCAKAYILEHDTAISTTRMLYFVTMCRKVFGINFPVKPAPPRIRLARFLGSLSIQEFRRNFTTVSSLVMEPPFIQNSMLIREQTRGNDLNCDIIPETTQEQKLQLQSHNLPLAASLPHDTVSAFTPLSSARPIDGSMYDTFMNQKSSEKTSNMAKPTEMQLHVQKTKKRKTAQQAAAKSEPAKGKGSLSAFVTFT